MSTSKLHWYETPGLAQLVMDARRHGALPATADPVFVQTLLGRLKTVDELLLACGNPVEPAGYSGTKSSMLPILGHLATSDSFSPYTWKQAPEVPNKVLELMRLAHQLGADVNGRTFHGIPVLNWAAMAPSLRSDVHNAAAVALLIDLGADVHALPHGGPEVMVEIARSRNGPAQAALITEALMRRQIAVASSSSAPTAQPRSRRRTNV